MTDPAIAVAVHSTRETLLRLVVAEAERQGIDAVLVAAVVQQESSFDPRAKRDEPQIGDASYGLMQLLYGTARWMGYQGTPEGLFDPATNVTLGVRFLRRLLHRYTGDVRSALAAYNAGPGNVDARGWTVVKSYVESVLRHAAALRTAVEALVAGGADQEPYREFPLEVPFISQLEPDGLGYNNCFAGEVRFLTDEGTKALAEMVGRSCRVLTEGGAWADAEVKRFGVQPLMKLTLQRRGHEKVIHATADHRWFTYVSPRGHGRIERLTRDLRPGAILVPTYGQGVGRARPSAFGIAHGITFGDGTRVRDRATPATLALAGAKNAELLRYFPLSPRLPVNGVGVRVGVLLATHRQRPAGAGFARPESRERGWVVVSVEPTDRVEEVYCAVVPSTGSFVLEDNILTGNCGPACVTMALAYSGALAGTREQMHQIAVAMRGGRPWYANTLTTFEQMAVAVAERGVPSERAHDWATVYRCLDGGRPVIMLLRNRLLWPRQYPVGPNFDSDHFVALLGHTDETFFVNDPLSVFTRGTVRYTRQTVHEAAAAIGAVQAIAIGDPVAATHPLSLEEDEMPLIRISDAELKQYLEQYGVGVNMETAIIKRACLAYRRNETRGPALSDEYQATSPDGRAVVRQNFTAGIAEWDPATGEVFWVEVVTHPEALGQTPGGAGG